MDINVKALKKNAFRVTKKRGLTASRIRVPGGHLDTASMDIIRSIADEFGNGTVHITGRQGFEIPDIAFGDMPEVNRRLQPVIEALCINQSEEGKGYTAAGTRNVAACIGNRVCPFACYDTTAFAKRLEKAIFPNDLHFKIALTGCPNDCAKVRMHDFGIMGMSRPEYDKDRCIGCESCVDKCRKKSAGALRLQNYKVERDEKSCIGCGECVLACPARAWTRSGEKRYLLTLLGRSGKKNPRMGIDFIKWVDEESITKIILNTYDYVTEYIDPDAPGGKEHIGYIVDRTGTKEFLNWALRGVVLPEGAEVKEPLYWSSVRG